MQLRKRCCSDQPAWGSSFYGISHIFSAIAISDTTLAVLYICMRSLNKLPVVIVVFQYIAALILLICCIILIGSHFQIKMLRELILQFRANVILLSMIILILLMFWRMTSSIEGLSTVDSMRVVCDSLVFLVNVCLLYLRDGMNVKYPTYIVVLGSVMLGSISLYNYMLVSLTKRSSEYPQWLSLMVAQAFFQVMVICYLSLYHLWRDRKNHYFVLIRKRQRTKDLWGDSGGNINVEIRGCNSLSDQLL